MTKGTKERFHGRAIVEPKLAFKLYPKSQPHVKLRSELPFEGSV